MSHFATALESLLQRHYGRNNAALAAKLGTSGPTVSRWRLATSSPDVAGLAMIVDQLPKDEAMPLIRAYLQDNLPAAAHSWYTFSDDALTEMPPPYVIGSLDPELRWAIEVLANAAVVSRDARDAIISSARYLRPDARRRAEAEADAELVRRAEPAANPTTAPTAKPSSSGGPSTKSKPRK